MNRGRALRLRRPQGPTLRRTATTSVLAVAALALTACSGGTSIGGSSSGGASSDASSPYGFATAKQDASAPITVWVDSTRLDAAKAYKKAHPGAKIKIDTYDGNANGSNTFKTKVQLFDRAGSGWPDVVFTTDDNSASWGSQAPSNFTAPMNKGLVKDSTLSGFAKGGLAPCTIDGTVYCLRNDLAQNVLWYNKTLMDKWGYKVPATWEDYQRLSDKVAAEHPGYLVGTAGDAWAPEIYMWGSECPANQVTGAKTITVKATDPKCVRAADLIDHTVKNHTMSTLSIFGPDFAKSQGDKVLMMPGPAWYGGAVFQGTLKTPKGQIAVAPALHWADQSPPVTGNVGGGAWWISSHSKNLKAASDFATWVTTADQYQADLAPGYPAYTAAAKKWVAKQQASGYWANEISGPIIEAAGEVWSGWGSPQFSQEAVWAKTILPAMAQGKTVRSMLPTWQKAIENQAQVAGYTVSK
jgi:ABC-type glycerol-3-phosphate transport system substrate-binding protein